MYDEETPRQGYSWWIISLGISILCCSLFFVFFATYLFSTRESQMLLTIRLSAMEQRVDFLMGELETLRNRSQVQQIQILPPPPAGTAVMAVPPVSGQTIEGGSGAPNAEVKEPAVPSGSNTTNANDIGQDITTPNTASQKMLLAPVQPSASPAVQ